MEHVRTTVCFKRTKSDDNFAAQVFVATLGEPFNENFAVKEDFGTISEHPYQASQTNDCLVCSDAIGPVAVITSDGPVQLLEPFRSSEDLYEGKLMAVKLNNFAVNYF
jgi:hypothetical protein